MKEFHKRIFTPGLFLGDTIFVFSNIFNFISALRNRELGRQFMEKVMTVVTAINGCTYCTWFHARQALASGLSPDEIKNMFNLQFHSDASDHEMPALLYAQHYTETNRNPDPDMTRKLFDFYGDRTARHIILFIRMIYFGNLQGNTFDAFLARLKGQKVKDGNFVFELLFFILNIPFMAPLIPFVRKDRKANA